MTKFAAILGLLVSVMALFATAQTSENAFEGSLRYKVNFSGGDLANRAQVAMMVPESYRLFIKGNQAKIHMQGGMIGMMMGEVVIDGTTGRGFVISHMNDTAYEISVDRNLKERAPPAIVDENETQVIAGYECRKYKVTRSNPSGGMIQYMWVTDAIQLDLAASFDGAFKDSMPFWTEGLSGLPLKIITSFPGMPMTMTMTATEVRRQEVDQSIFVVPAGYAIETLDTNRLFGR